VIWPPQGRESVVLLVLTVVAIALLVAFARAALEQRSEEHRKRLERQPPLPTPPADLRGSPAPPALTSQDDCEAGGKRE
jgi:hypothetical protein